MKDPTTSSIPQPSCAALTDKKPAISSCDGQLIFFGWNGLEILCLGHATERGYFNGPHERPDHEETQAYAALHTECEDAGKHPEALPENLKSCCKRHIVFYLPETDGHVTLCTTHAARRGYLGRPFMLPTANGLKFYDKLCRRKKIEDEWNRVFVQTWHPELVCAYKQDDCAKHEVAEYYGSDGGTAPICSRHVEKSGCMWTSKPGQFMSREYYDQVYTRLHREFDDVETSAVAASPSSE